MTSSTIAPAAGETQNVRNFRMPDTLWKSVLHRTSAESVTPSGIVRRLLSGWANAARPRLVIIESPYAGDVAANEEYARAAMADSLARGEAPLASHLLYTQPGVLDDADPAHRAQGITAGLAWGQFADLTAVYVDRGFTPGMKAGLDAAVAAGRPFEIRELSK